jgi:prepilin-type N-terminal cleavage/methylation domain-containing protein
MYPWASSQGFTLIELLVVIAIICILAGLLMPAVSTARRQSNDTKCISNLRQLGVGILAYATDHDSTLPGPCPTGMGTTLSSSAKTQLIYFLQPYLGLPKPTTTAYHPEILHCPAADALAAQKGLQWYNLTLMAAYANNTLPPSKNYMSKQALGDSDSTPALPPLRLGSIFAAINPAVTTTPGGSAATPSEIPVIREIDGSLSTTWPWPVAATPFHGDHENCLFLDWHVGRLNPADYKVN